MNKILKSIIINKITEWAKKIYYYQSHKWAQNEKKNSNYAENANERNVCNMKVKEKQNDHDHKRECNESIRSRIVCQIFTQAGKKNIKLNNSMNQNVMLIET